VFRLCVYGVVPTSGVIYNASIPDRFDLIYIIDIRFMSLPMAHTYIYIYARNIKRNIKIKITPIKA